MNRQKHKLSRRILAVLLMAAMLITMLPSAMFAAPGGDDWWQGGGGSTQPENAVSINKTATRVGPDTWDVKMTVTASEDIQSEPLELVLLLDRSGSMAWCTHSDHGYNHWNYQGGKWCNYQGEKSSEDSRQAIAGNAAKELIDDLANKGITASVSVVGFASNANEILKMTSLTADSAQDIKHEIPTSNASGSTNMNAGLKEANSKFSSNATNKVIIMLADGDYDGADPNNPWDGGYVSTLERNNVTVHTIGFTTENNTLEKIADTTGGNYYTADDAEDLADVFTQIAGNLTAMVEDDMGDDVEIVTRSANADNGTVSVSRDGKLSWNPEDGKLGAGQSAEITYTVKLTDEKKAALQAGDNTVHLNGDAVLTYKLNGQGETYTMGFPRPTDNVEYAKLSVDNYIDGEKSADSYSDQSAVIYGDDGLTWVAPSDLGEDYTYAGSKLIKPDQTVEQAETITEEKFATATAEPGEYTLIHNYTTGLNGTDVTIQVIVNGAETPVEDPLNYVNIGRNTEDTTRDQWELVGDGAVDGILTYDFNYNPTEGKGYDCVDIDVSLTADMAKQYVLQGVIYNESFGSGSPSEVTLNNKDGYKIDNLVGDGNSEADCTIYLSTKYSAAYYLDGEPQEQDDNIYISSQDMGVKSSVLSKPTEDDQTKQISWMNTAVKSEITLKTLPTKDGYTVNGWYLGTDREIALSGAFNTINTDSDTADGKTADRVIEFHATSTENVPTINEDDIIEAFGDDIVKVDCVGTFYGSKHTEGTYALQKGGFTFTNPAKAEDGSYYVTVTVDPVNEDQMAKYVALYNADEEHNGNVTNHTLKDGQEAQAIKLKYDAGQGWIPATTGQAIMLKVICADPANLSGITKEVVADPATINGLPEGNYNKVENEKVTVNEGDKITLVYKITVAGDAGAGFKVTDEDETSKAVLLTKPEGMNSKVGAEGTFVGTIPSDKEIVFYVSKSFGPVDRELTSVTNVAVVENTGDGKEPDDKDDDVTVPVEVTPIYTIDGVDKFYVNDNDERAAAEKAGIKLDSYAFPSEGKVIVPNDGSAIKLLYGITVTGQKGATFTVKDTGAELVKDQKLPTDDADKALIGVAPGATDSFTGTIPDGGSVTFYVEKSFTKDNIENGELLNTATITEGDIDPGDEDKTDEEPVPAEEKATLDSIDKFYVNPKEATFVEGETSPAIDLTKYAGLDEYGNIVIPENGTVTVLYGITVKGTPGASFYVMDDSALFVAAATTDTLSDEKSAISGSKDAFTGTFPADGEVTFYVSKIFDADDIGDDGQIDNTAIAQLDGDKATKEDTETNNAIVEETVEIPGDEELIVLIGDKVTVDCVNGNVNPEHPNKVYGLVDKDHYTVSGLTQNASGQPTFTVTLNTDEYIADYSKEIGKEHKLSSDGDYKFTLSWDGNKWIVEPDEGLVIKVECVYGITDFDKFLVANDEQKKATSLTEEELARFTFPDEKGRINLPKDGKVTLLYGITVTGVADEEFTVTDENALLTPDIAPTVKNTDNGIFTGTIPEDGSITFYVEKVFTIDDVKTGFVENEESLVNVAKITDGDVIPGKEDDEEIVPVATGYSLTYEANGGYFANDPAKTTATVGELNPAEYPLWTKDTAVSTIPVDENGKELAKPTHAQAAPPEDTVISDADLVDVELIGWTTEVPEPAGQIYAAGDKYPTLTDKATIEDDNVIVYAVWGYDENNDGVADATQIVITPADITIYSGGSGYEGVLGENGELVGTEGAQNGLPEPGYYFILPYQLNDKLGGATNIIDLSGKLHLDYVNQDNANDVRGWNLELYSKSNPEQSMAYGKYVYRLIPQTAGYPVRLEIKDGDNLVSSDNFTISLDSLSKTYSMKLYTAPEVDRVQVTAQIRNDENEWVDANEALGDNVVQGIARGTATLTIRGTNEDQPVSAIQNTVAEEVDAITAVEPENVDYYINGSKIPVVMNESASNVQLLNDTIVNESGSQDVMENAIVSEAANDPDVNIDADYAFDFRYLDLVDTDNGNAYVTMGEGQEMTIYWPYPEGMDMNDTFYVAHFDGLDREFTAEELNTAVANSDLKLYHEGDATYELETTEYGIKFTTSSFSPFALVYDASQADDGDDNPPYYPWHPDGDDDGPSGLNTEDHFSYVVGYAEDYRTGEATDNEDLWPVKPNNQITRAEVATIFYRLLEDEVRDEYDTTTNDFSDVTADSWYNQTVSTLARMGIVKGYEDGSFRPNAPITRAEFGAIATRFFAETGATYEPGTFTDVTGDEWFANAIQDAVNLGLIGGYPDGTVRPNNNITRAEACAIVNRTLGRVPDADHLLPEDVMKVWPDNNPTDWFYADMQEATNGHEYAWIEEDGHEIEEWTNLLDKDWTDR